LKRKCDEPHSNFAFNFNLRHYKTGNLDLIVVTYNNILRSLLPAGAYTRPLLSSTQAVSATKTHPTLSLKPPDTP
jgi:hypothetical protein